MTPVNKEKFETGVGYIDGHDMNGPSNVITGGTRRMVYNNAVVGDDGKRYNLEVTTNFDMSVNASSSYMYPRMAPTIMTPRGKTKAKSTLKVLNSSGAAVDWTGVIGLGGLSCSTDNNKRGSIVYINPSMVKTNIYTGTKCAAIVSRDSNTRYQYKAKDNELVDKSYLYNNESVAVSHAYYIKVSIPTSGLVIETTAKSSDNSDSVVLSAYAGYKQFDSTTKLSSYIKDGGWKTY